MVKVGYGKFAPGRNFNLTDPVTSLLWFKSHLFQRYRYIETVKPVYNDHLYNKIYYLRFIQKCVLMKTEGTNLILVTMSAFWSSSRWPLAP